jgi:hypothetical protein
LNLGAAVVAASFSVPAGQPFDAELLGDAVRPAVIDVGWLAALVDGVLVGARADAPGRPEPRPNRTYNEITRRTTVISRTARRRQ